MYFKNVINKSLVLKLLYEQHIFYLFDFEYNILWQKISISELFLKIFVISDKRIAKNCNNLLNLWLKKFIVKRTYAKLFV